MDDPPSESEEGTATTDRDKQTNPNLCSLCEGTFIHLKLLPNCTHSFCCGCLRDIVDHNRAACCPICSQPIPLNRQEVDYLPTEEYFTTLLLDSADSRYDEWPHTLPTTRPVTCSLCPDDNDASRHSGENSISNCSLATSWCGSCCQYMCRRCTGVHAKGNTTKHHKVDAVRDVAVQPNITRQSDASLSLVAEKLNTYVLECEVQLKNDLELKRQVLAEHDKLQRLIDCHRDNLVAQLSNSSGTAIGRDLVRHVLVLKCFVQYCNGRNPADIDRRIDQIIEQLDDNGGQGCPLPIAAARSWVNDMLSLTSARVQDYLPAQVFENLIGTLTAGSSTAANGLRLHKTWDEQGRTIANQTRELNELQEQLADITRKETEVRESITLNGVLIEDLKQQLDKSNNLRHSAENNVQMLQQQVDNLTADINRLSAERDGLLEKVQSLEDERNELINTQKLLLDNVTELDDELRQVKQAHVTFVDEQDKLTTTYEATKQKAKEQSEELDASKEHGRQLMLQLDKAHKTENETLSQLNQSKDRYVSLKHRAEATDRRCAELENKLLGEAVKSKQREDELMQSLKSVATTRENLSKQFSEVCGEREQLRSEISELVKVTQSQSAEVQAVTEQNELLQQELNRCQQREDELNKQLMLIENKEQRSEKRICQLESRVQQLIDEQLAPTAVPAYELNGFITVHGVTSLDDEFYLARANSSQIEVYSAVTYVLQRHLVVKATLDVVDMTSCGTYRCLYIADGVGSIVHRVEVSKVHSAISPTSWSVGDKPYGLSVTSTECHVLVTCNEVNRLKEFTTHGQLVRQILLESSVVSPRHAVQLPSGQLVVCHGDLLNNTQRVCLITADGRGVVKSYGGHLLNCPTHIAVDRSHGFIYVADSNKRRVVILDKNLIHVGELGGIQYALRFPRCLWLDVDCKRLFVGECGGRVTVYVVIHSTTTPSAAAASKSLQVRTN